MSDYDDCDYEYTDTRDDLSDSVQSAPGELSAKAKARVDKITISNPELAGQRCIIENMGAEGGATVEYFCCLPLETKPETLDKLEYAWNMQHGTLNVESRFNVLRMGSKMRKLFDQHMLILMPEPDIVFQYWNAVRNGLPRDQFPQIGDENTIYKYTLVPSNEVSSISLYRQNMEPNANVSTNSTTITEYQYPYFDFPTILSHVHPRFVICRTGIALHANCDFLEEEFPLLDDMLSVIEIWDIWAAGNSPKLPKEFLSSRPPHGDTNTPSDDDDDTKTDCTHPHRYTHGLPGCGGNDGHERLEFANGYPKKADEIHTARLEYRTLRELDRQMSSRQVPIHDRKHVLRWLNNVDGGLTNHANVNTTLTI